MVRTMRSAMKVEELFERDPEKMGGAAVFPGTRVPIKFLFEFLEDDQTIGTFLYQFPMVSRTQALAVLRGSRDLLLSIPTNADGRFELMQEFATGELPRPQRDARRFWATLIRKIILHDLLVMACLAGETLIQ